jgi:hypothetical protein
MAWYIGFGTMMDRVSTAKWAVLVAAVEAAATGLLLILSPPVFSWLIFDAELSDAGQALGRLTGIALLGFALVTWPPPAQESQPPAAVRALLIYNLLAAIYLAYVGLAGHLVGVLLWPAVALHAIFSIVLARARFGSDAK